MYLPQGCSCTVSCYLARLEGSLESSWTRSWLAAIADRPQEDPWRGQHSPNLFIQGVGLGILWEPTFPRTWLRSVAVTHASPAESIALSDLF